MQTMTGSDRKGSENMSNWVKDGDRCDYRTLSSPVTVEGWASVVGRHEHEGPLGAEFDAHDASGRFGEDTWERSEAEMQRTAINLALSKAGVRDRDIDALFSGDLVNQCTCSSSGSLCLDLPYFGLYGACSTSAEGLILASMLIGTGMLGRACVSVSSHNSTAERQFRYPLEYGGQRTPTSQWTVTGSGAFVLRKSAAGDTSLPRIVGVQPGVTVDRGISDAANMGAAMAPAAILTLSRFFRQTQTSPADYDMILTGDLGAEGSAILVELMAGEGYDMGTSYNDCGLLIYDTAAQDMRSGGSGCGCSASVLASHILPRLGSGELKNVLFVATGALMSPMSVQQGDSIPGVAHLVHLCCPPC